MAHSPVSQARPGSSGLVMLAALAMLLALAAPPAATAQQEEQDEVTPARVDGQTRFHTAANLATFLFDEAEVAHIVFAGDFPDALAASFGAGATGGPILPVPRPYPVRPTPTPHITAHPIQAFTVDRPPCHPLLNVAFNSSLKTQKFP